MDGVQGPIEAGTTLTSGRTLPSSTASRPAASEGAPGLVHRRQGWERIKQTCTTGRESEQHPSCVTVPRCSLGHPLPLPTFLPFAAKGGRKGHWHPWHVGTRGHIQGLAPRRGAACQTEVPLVSVPLAGCRWGCQSLPFVTQPSSCKISQGASRATMGRDFQTFANKRVTVSVSGKWGNQ